MLATNIDDSRTVILLDDDEVGPIWQALVASGGDREWWTREQRDRAICTAAISIEAPQPAKMKAAFELTRDAWEWAIVGGA